MFILTWSPAEHCSHCNSSMHGTSECMPHAMQMVQSAARCLKLRGFDFTGPDIHQHGKRQRLHAGPGWSHLSTIGYGEVGTMYFEIGISRLPNPACVEDSGTFVVFRKSSHTDQASVITVAVTPTPFKKTVWSPLGSTKQPASDAGTSQTKIS